MNRDFPRIFSKVFAAVLILSLILSPLSLSSAAFAQQSGGQTAHYIVLQGSQEQGYEVIHYQEVELMAKLESMSISAIQNALATSSRHANLIIAALEDRAGNTVYQGIVDTSPWLRGEWRGEANPQEIDGRVLKTDKFTFAVRVPRIAGTMLVLKKNLGSTIQQFDLAEIVKSAPRIENSLESKLTLSEPFGPPGNRVDILVMGDGYTAAQEGLFNTHLQTLMNGFYGKQPLTNYRNYTNMATLFTVSPESGADHPIYVTSDKCPGYDNPNCCTDPEMLNDPLNGQMVNTAFDARYCSWEIHRLLVADEGKLLAEAGRRYPDWDTIIVLVNDVTYGGSASGKISVISVDEWLPDVAQHEFGHAFGDLADEYDDAYPGFPGCSDRGGTPCEANVTDVSIKANIKWLPWIGPDTPIPTPPNGGYGPGLYTGARYLRSGMYRSDNACLMKYLGQPFCDVPTQAMVLRFYKGGWGTPSAGMTMLEPGT